MTNIEILLLDDASPDRCGVICEEYAKKDARFHVFHNETNQGLSVARNFGISKAAGHYLMFVDSDDWVHEDFCKEAYQCAVGHQVDLVIFRFRQFNEGGRENTKVINPAKGKSSGCKTRFEAIELLQCGDIWNAAWNKIYRKELFRTISYPPGYMLEDVGTTYKLIWQASSVYYLDKALYNYCYHKGSISTLKTKKIQHDLMVMGLQQYNDLSSWGYPKEKLEKILFKLAMTYCILTKPNPSDPHYIMFADVLQHCKLSLPDVPWKRRIMLLLFKYVPELFEMVCTLYGRKIYDNSKSKVLI